MPYPNEMVRKLSARCIGSAVMGAAFFLSAAFTQAALNCPPPGPVFLYSPGDDAAIGEVNYGVNFSWENNGDATWHQIYINKDGALFHKEWISGPVDEWFWPDSLPLGSYEWWVRPYSPCGTGAWSDPETFSVVCTALPTGQIYTPSSEQAFDGEFPYFELDIDSSTTWMQLEIQREGQPFLSKWYSREDVYLSELYGRFMDVDWTDGLYQVRYRQWSKCNGNSAWSGWTGFSLVNVSCTGTPPATEVTHVDLIDYCTGADDYSVYPNISWVSLGITSRWYHVFIADAAAPDVPVLQEWVQYESLYVYPELDPGDYLVKVKSWNACGKSGPYSPNFPFTISCQSITEVTGLGVQVSSYDKEKYADLVFDAQSGVHWFQVWINCDGKNISKRWYDTEDYDQGVYCEEGAVTIEGISLPPQGEEYEVWVRGWSRCHGIGAWNATPYEFATPCVPLVKPTGLDVDLSYPDMPVFQWNEVEGADTYGIWVECDGFKFFVDEVDAVVSCWTEQSDSNTFAEVGIAQGWKADEQIWELPLGFSFPFCGSTYSNGWVDSNGRIAFESIEDGFGAGSFGYDQDQFQSTLMIAPLWSDLDTSSGDIYVDTSIPDQITIRWSGVYYDTDVPVNFSVTLLANGQIVCRYGSVNSNIYLNGIGVSAGDGMSYLLSINHDQPMGDAGDVLFDPSGSSKVFWEAFWYFPPGSYEWWIQPKSPCYGKGPWSDGHQFEIPEFL